MGTAKQMLAVANNEVGYLEKASNANLNSKTANAGSNNYTKYGAWYGLNGPSAYWCHMFVSWCAAQSGNANIVPKTASCYNGRDWFKARGRFHLRQGYTPKPGDIVYYSTAQYPYGGGHVGIVEKVVGNTVYTIEGNTSGASGVVANGGGVAKKSYSLSYNKIYGYGSPDYDSEEEDLTEAQIRNVAKEITDQAIEEYSTKYKKLENVPESYYDAVKKVIDKGALKGTGNGIELSEDLARILTILDRLGKLD